MLGYTELDFENLQEEVKFGNFCNIIRAIFTEKHSIPMNLKSPRDRPISLSPCKRKFNEILYISVQKSSIKLYLISVGNWLSIFVQANRKPLRKLSLIEKKPDNLLTGIDVFWPQKLHSMAGGQELVNCNYIIPFRVDPMG